MISGSKTEIKGGYYSPSIDLWFDDKKAYSRAYAKNWRNNNRGYFLDKQREYWLKNRDKLNAYKRVYYKKYREDNKEKIYDYNKEYYKIYKVKNKENIRAYRNGLQRRYIDSLNVNYVSRLLGLNNNAPQELIELKRSQIKLWRAIRNK